MKIIKNGIQSSAPSGWWIGKVFKCFKCLCEVRLEQGDRVEFSYGNGYEYLGINCPEFKQFSQNLSYDLMEGMRRY